MSHKGNWFMERMNYCYPKTKNGTTKYYAVVQQEYIEVEKEIYDVLERSYRKEWSWDHEDRIALSIEQLAEDAILADKHGSIPASLQSISSEDEFLQAQDSNQDRKLVSLILQEISKLSADDRMVFDTCFLDSESISRVAKEMGLTERSIYYRRNIITQRIRNAVSRGVGK